VVGTAKKFHVHWYNTEQKEGQWHLSKGEEGAMAPTILAGSGWPHVNTLKCRDADCP